MRAWLDDAAGSESILSAPGGIEFSNADLFLWPPTAGSFRVNASAVDACGNTNQTGVVRRVTVR